MYLSMIIILTDFHLLLSESIFKRTWTSKMLSDQFEECSPRGGYQYWNYFSYSGNLYQMHL